MAAMERPDRVAVVCAGLLYALIECLFGLVLAAAAMGRGHLPGTWLTVVKSVAHTDVGAFPARWLLGTTRGLQRSGKALLGIGLDIDGAVKAGLLVGVLRGSRTACVLAAVVFGAIAVGGIIVAGANPPVGSFVTALLNGALAVVVALEVRRVVTDHASAR